MCPGIPILGVLALRSLVRCWDSQLACCWDFELVRWHSDLWCAGTPIVGALAFDLAVLAVQSWVCWQWDFNLGYALASVVCKI